MHLFRLNHREEDEAVKSSPVLPTLIPTHLLPISHHLYCLLLYCSTPFPASMRKDLSSPSEEAQAFLSSVLNHFLCCHSFHPRLCLLSILGKPTSSSLSMPHKWHNRWRGVILQQFQEASWHGRASPAQPLPLRAGDRKTWLLALKCWAFLVRGLNSVRTSYYFLRG